MKGYEKLFILSIPLLIVHAIEEYFTKFYNFDPLFGIVGRLIGRSSVTVFLIEQTVLFGFLVYGIVSIKQNALPKFSGFLLGLIFLVELSHPVLALKHGGYSPGLISGILTLILGFFYWRELIKS